MPTCFVIMPITTPDSLIERYGGDPDHFRNVFRSLFSPALEDAGFDVEAPDATGSEVIQARIIGRLQDGDLVLCDLSTSNPNVLFELGVRVAVNRPVALVRDAFLPPGAIFDINVAQCPEYAWDLRPWNIEEETRKIQTHARSTLDQSAGKNALWRTFSIQTEARLEASGNAFEESVLSSLSNLTFGVGMMERRIAMLEDATTQSAPDWSKPETRATESMSRSERVSQLRRALDIRLDGADVEWSLAGPDQGGKVALYYGRDARESPTFFNLVRTLAEAHGVDLVFRPMG